jgi:hypothetical protein
LAVGNLSPYIKTPAPPLSTLVSSHQQRLLQRYTPQPTTTTTTTTSLPSIYTRQSALPAYNLHPQSTQWPLSPTTSPPWLATTSLPARDHHQHALCLRCPPNKLGRHAIALFICSFQASTGVLAQINIDIYHLIPTSSIPHSKQATMHCIVHHQQATIFDVTNASYPVHLLHLSRNLAGDRNRHNQPLGTSTPGYGASLSSRRCHSAT